MNCKEKDMSRRFGADRGGYWEVAGGWGKRENLKKRRYES